MNRRDFIKSAVPMMGAACLAGAGTAAETPKVAPKGKSEFHAFSRVFQFLGIEKAAELLRECGYDGVEWTVRKKGFVEPSDAKNMLPRAMAAARANGLRAQTIVVEFLDPFEGNNLDLLKVAADNGVEAFRTGYFKYDGSLTVQENLSKIRSGFAALDKAARQTGLRFVYQNHSTYNRKVPLFGSLVWDLWEVIREFDPRHVGVQYDVMHAQAESGPSWQRGLELVAPWIATLCLKDFCFEMSTRYPGDWQRKLLPAGEGIVPWDEFQALCRKYGVNVPYAIHYDYKFPEDRAGAAACAKKDIDFFRQRLG